jgi:hypothetical protein
MKAYDFKAWLETKNPNEEYNFGDCHGDCAYGQYMAARGHTWHIQRYVEGVNETLGGDQEVLNSQPQTFGALLWRVKKVLEAA